MKHTLKLYKPLDELTFNDLYIDTTDDNFLYIHELLSNIIKSISDLLSDSRPQTHNSSTLEYHHGFHFYLH